ASLKQMEDAAKAIRGIDDSKLPAKGGKGSGKKSYQKVEYADEVAKILEAHNITLHVTSEYGQVMELNDWLKRYAFLLWDKQRNPPGVTPPPPPPPAPPPGP